VENLSETYSRLVVQCVLKLWKHQPIFRILCPYLLLVMQFLCIYMCVCVRVCVQFDYLVKIIDSYVAVHKVQTVLMIFSIFVEHKVKRVVRSTFGPREKK